MRVLAVILVFVAAVLTALLVMNSDEKVLRTVPASSNAAVDGVTLAKPVTVAVPESVQAEGSSGTDKEAGELISRAIPLFETAESKLPPPEDAVCLRFGPILEKNLKKLRNSLERIGWMDRVQIKSADLAERIVYAGPYSTEAKAAKALEKLVQEGLRKGKLFALDEKGWGIEIARTPERLQAENWAREATNAWALKNVIVMEHNPREGYVELVFPNISQDENKLLIKTFKGREGGKFSACQP